MIVLNSYKCSWICLQTILFYSIDHKFVKGSSMFLQQHLHSSKVIWDYIYFQYQDTFQYRRCIPIPNSLVNSAWKILTGNQHRVKTREQFSQESRGTLLILSPLGCILNEQVAHKTIYEELKAEGWTERVERDR